MLLLTINQLSSELKAIGQGAFKNCAALGEIKLPPGLITIGPGAFMFCTALKDIVKFPAAVEYSTLTHSEAAARSRRWIYLRGWWPFVTALSRACVSLSQITLPDGLRHIGNNCFDGCTHLGNSITKLPSALQILGQSAFSNIPKINALALPEDSRRIPYACSGRCRCRTKDVADVMMRKQKHGSKVQRLRAGARR